MRTNRHGFTLVEIMIVVAIIGILAAIALPNFSRNRTTSQRNACVANLRLIQGGVELVLIRGEELTNETLANEVKPWGTLRCPSTKQVYPFPKLENSEYVAYCGSGLDGHVQSFSTEKE